MSLCGGDIQCCRYSCTLSSFLTYLALRGGGDTPPAICANTYVLRVTLLKTNLQHSLVVGLSRSRFGDGAIPLIVPPFGLIVSSLLTGGFVDAPHPLRRPLPLEIRDVLQQTGTVGMMCSSLVLQFSEHQANRNYR